MIPIMAAALSRPPTGRGRPTGPTAPPDVGAILVTSTEASWSGYAEPAGFEGYLLRTTGTAGTAWERATVLAGPTSASTVALSALPASAVEILVKAAANGLESINAARGLLPGVPPPPPPGDDWKIPNHLTAGKTPVNIASKAAYDAAKGSFDPATQYFNFTARMAGFVLDKGGTEAHPAVHTCAMPALESDWLDFAGRNGFDDGRVILAAPWIWLFGVKCRRTARTDNTSIVQIKADDVLVTCCQLDAPCGILNKAGDSPGWRYHLGFNEYTGVCNTATGNDLNEGQVLLQCTKPPSEKQPDFGDIYMSVFRQSAEPGGSETHCVYSGPGIADPSGQRDRPYDIGLPNTRCRNNLILTRRARAIYRKHPFDALDNHIVAVDAWNSTTPRASGGALQMATHRGCNTIRGRTVRNRIEAGEQLAVQGWDCLVQDNVLTNGCEIQLYVHCDNANNPKTLLGANGARCINNRGRLVVGMARLDPGFSVVATDKLRDVTIEGHVGAIVDADGVAIAWGPAEADGYSRPNRTLPNCVTNTIRWRADADVPHAPPPSYDLNTCGPRAPGKTWGGGAPPPPDPLAIGASYAVNYAHKTGGSGGGGTRPAWLSGLGNGWGEVPAMEAFLGRQVTCNAGWTVRANWKSWEHIAGGSLTGGYDTFGGVFQTAEAGNFWGGMNSSRRASLHHIWMHPVLPEGAPGGWDNGDNDKPAIWAKLKPGGSDHTTWKNFAYSFGRRLVNKVGALGIPYDQIHLNSFWEFSLNSWPWTAGTDQASFKAAEISFYTEARRGFRDSDSAAEFAIKFAWRSANKFENGCTYANTYPGDEFIDTIACGMHEQTNDWRTQSGWNFELYGPQGQGGNGGIQNTLDFAKSRGKKFSSEEWSIHNEAADNQGSDPSAPDAFQRVFGWLNANKEDIAYEAYMHESVYQITDRQSSLGSRKYKELWSTLPTVPAGAGSPGGTITQPAAGKVRMAGGVADVNAPATLLTIGRLFNRGLLAKPFEVEAKITRKLVPASTTTHGGFVHVGLAMPTNAAPARAPADWPAAMDMRDEEVAKILRGWRATMANVNTTTAAESNRLRLRTYNGTDTNSRTVVDPDTDQVVDFGLDVARTVRVRFAGSSVRVEVVELGRVATFAHADLGAFSQGYLMFTVSYDMDAEIADVRRLS